jgi:hypothetical protein
MMDRVLEVLLKQVRERRDQLILAVSQSAAKDFADYQKLCGEIRGLSTTEGYILDLAKLMEQSDE